MQICLIGSSRFETQFKAWNEHLTLRGHTVYSLAVYPSDKLEREWYTDEQKTMLDLVHLNKILCSEEVVCVNCARLPQDDLTLERDDYVGDSTKREIVWAKMQGKQLHFTSVRSSELTY